MPRPIRLLVVGEFAYNSGSSNVVAEYARAGPAAGFEVRIAAGFGRSDARVKRALPQEADAAWATHALVIYEGRPFLDEAAIARLDRAVPHRRRVAVDCDGHCAPLVSVDGDDNAWPCGQPAWREAFAAAGAVTLQPSIGEASPGTIRWPYFGMPPLAPASNRRPRIAMQYVGNNWFRAAALLELFAAMRAVSPRAHLQVRGRGWDGSTLPGLEHGTYADPAALASLGVRVARPAPFGGVVAAMGRALLSPVLLRPVLSQLGLITPRMFETAAASTLPVYTAADARIGALYAGTDGALCLGTDLQEGLRRVLDDLPRCQAVAAELRARLAAEYSYAGNLERLRAILD